MTRRQVFEIPQISARVTEHRLAARRCSCGAVTCADAPAGVDAPVQYGPRLAAIVVYLLVARFGVQKRVAQSVADLFGVPISQGSVAALTARAARRLEGDFRTAIRTALAAAQLVHFDETVRHEALVRRKARITEGGVRPLRLVVAAAGWELGAA